MTEPIADMISPEPSMKRRHEAAERILSILDAFADGHRLLSLTDIAERTGLYKSTVHRNVQSLLEFGYLVRGNDRRFRLGPAALRLSTAYEQAFNVDDHVRPVLQRLLLETQETAAFYVREGDGALCLLRYNSPQPVAHHIREGTMLPVDSGRTGRSFLAFSGERGEHYDEIRLKGYNAGLSERVTDSFSATAPVFGFDGNLVGALTISAPRSRYSEAYLGHLIPACTTAAREISRGLGFEPSVRPLPFAGRSFRGQR
jgi:DNA-binding IclR family transcriptional regulator